MVRNYLLGELAEDEQRRFEEELMSGARSFEELLAAEDELVDQYVAGALAGRERERFEHHFLATPERRRKLSFARTLRRYVADAAIEVTPVEGATADLSSTAPSSTAPAPSTAETTDEESADEEAADEPSTDKAPSGAESSRTPAWARLLPPSLRAQPPLARYAFAAVLLLAVSVGALSVFNALRGPRTGGAVVAITLTPGAVRASDGGVKQIQLAPDTGVAELRLSLPAATHTRYHADITPVDKDRPVFSTPEETGPLADASGPLVLVRVPAELLTPGAYKLTLRGAQTGGAFEDVDTYYFRVTPQRVSGEQ